MTKNRKHFVSFTYPTWTVHNNQKREKSLYKYCLLNEEGAEKLILFAKGMQYY